MKYLKTFELHSNTGNIVDYEVGDIVVCSDAEILNLRTTKHNPLSSGVKYNVLKIYRLPEDVYLGNKDMRVDVENMETGEISKGWDSKRFKSDIEFDAGKYNM